MSQQRVVVITGAASGIGRELAKLYAARGDKVGLLDRDRRALNTLADEIDAEAAVSTAVADVRERAQTREAVRQVTDALGPVDIAISCAGICRASTVDDLNIPEAEDVLRINLMGTLYFIDAVLPSMLQRGRGRIVGISSLAGVRGIPFEPAYSASKAAVGAYLESLRPDLRSRGVGVTTVFPGFVQTPLLDHMNGTLGADMANGKAVTAPAAARQIVRAIDMRKSYVSFPRTLGMGVHLSRLLPPRVYDLIMERQFARFSMLSAKPILEPEKP
jgi:short-subunit dehydrogenase